MDCPGFTRLDALSPTFDPSSRIEPTSCIPVTCTEAARVPSPSPPLELESQFLKRIFRQLPALARSTSGRGRFPGRNRWLLQLGVPPVLLTRSCSSTYISWLGSWAPSRLYQTNCSIATTLATKVRLHCAAASPAAR